MNGSFPSLHSELHSVWFQRVAIFLVFLLALGVRLYWVAQKTGFHGDELTSLSIIWNGVDGKGNLMHDAHRVYSADELRHFFADETGGWSGLSLDLRALWHDNQDVPHASLYYMLLRCALTAVTHPSPEAVIWWGCALNLLFFTISFFTAARLLCERCGRKMWPVFALALGYLNSIAVSNTLFLREYALAEMAIVVLAYCVLHLSDRLSDGRPLLRPLTLLGTVGAVALALSSGYVNAFLVVLWAVWLTVRAYRYGHLRTTAIFLCTVGVLSVATCWAVYQGFFNYVLDPRIERTSEKLQAYSFLAELWMTIKGTARLFILRVFTPVGTVLAVVGLWLTVRHRRYHNVNIPCGMWLGLCLWVAVYMFVVPWKDERFLAPGLTLLLFFMSTLLPRVLPAVALCSLATCFNADLISYKSRTNAIDLDVCHRLVLLGPDAEERKMAALLTAETGPRQELVIVESQKEVIRWQSPKDSTFLLLTATYESPHIILLRKYDVIRSGKLNLWMNFYELRARDTKKARQRIGLNALRHRWLLSPMPELPR